MQDFALEFNLIACQNLGVSAGGGVDPYALIFNTPAEDDDSDLWIRATASSKQDIVAFIPNPDPGQVIRGNNINKTIAISHSYIENDENPRFELGTNLVRRIPVGSRVVVALMDAIEPGEDPGLGQQVNYIGRFSLTLPNVTYGYNTTVFGCKKG